MTVDDAGCRLAIRLSTDSRARRLTAQVVGLRYDFRQIRGVTVDGLRLTSEQI
ncbi:MAG: hypothetical protein SR1Q7_11065 [Quinella sp. 1Q7]|nr:hypothetical protein [Quinella sp. 1Q7]